MWHRENYIYYQIINFQKHLQIISSLNFQFSNPIKLSIAFSSKCPRIWVTFWIAIKTMLGMIYFLWSFRADTFKESAPEYLQFHAFYFFYYCLFNSFKVFLVYNDVQIWSRNICISFSNKKPYNIVNFWGKPIFKGFLFSIEAEAKYGECFLDKCRDILFNFLMNWDFFLSDDCHHNHDSIFVYTVFRQRTIFMSVCDLYLFWLKSL